MFKSPLTSVLGVILILATWLQQAIGDKPIPQTGKEWLTFLIGNATGLVALFAKDFNKSNAPEPTTEAHSVTK